MGFPDKRPDLSNGGLHLPYTEDGLRQFESPRTIPAYQAATLTDSTHGYLLGPKKIIMTLHVNWGRASSRQLRRVSAGSDGDNVHLLTCVDYVPE